MFIGDIRYTPPINPDISGKKIFRLPHIKYSVINLIEILGYGFMSILFKINFEIRLCNLQQIDWLIKLHTCKLCTQKWHAFMSTF